MKAIGGRNVLIPETIWETSNENSMKSSLSGKSSLRTQDSIPGPSRIMPIVNRPRPSAGASSG